MMYRNGVCHEPVVEFLLLQFREFSLEIVLYEFVSAVGWRMSLSRDRTSSISIVYVLEEIASDTSFASCVCS